MDKHKITGVISIVFVLGLFICDRIIFQTRFTDSTIARSILLFLFSTGCTLLLESDHLLRAVLFNGGYACLIGLVDHFYRFSPTVYFFLAILLLVSLNFVQEFLFSKR